MLMKILVYCISTSCCCLFSYVMTRVNCTDVLDDSIDSDGDNIVLEPFDVWLGLC